MKWLLLILLSALGVAFYLGHVKSLKDAEANAELTAYNQTQSQIAQAAAAREHRPQMAIAQLLEPLVTSVEAPLHLGSPVDLRPTVQITRQHILDKRLDAEPARALVFDRAAAVLNYLNALADDRSKSLESMIHNRAVTSTAFSSTEDSPGSANFFNQSVEKRWETVLARARPVLIQLMDQLRVAERAWNKQARQEGSPEQYDLAGLTPVMLPVPTPSESTVGKRSSTPVSRVYRGLDSSSTLAR